MAKRTGFSPAKGESERRANQRGQRDPLGKVNMPSEPPPARPDRVKFPESERDSSSFGK